MEIELVDILIKHGEVLTMDKNRRVIHDGAVAIEENRIVDVGKTDKLARVHRGEKIIDAKGTAVLPGLVNVHTHLHQTLLRSLGDDYKLIDWLDKMMFPLTKDMQPDEAYYAASIGCLELIKSGCTCTADNHQHWGTHDDCLRAMLDIGIRGIEARGHYDRDPWNVLQPELLEDTEASIRDNVELARRWEGKGDGRLHVWFGMQWPPACSEKMLEMAYDKSRELGVGIMMHLQECEDEVVRWKKETGYSPIQYYHRKKVRILGSNLLAVHCVWTDDEDIRILKETNTKVSHCSICNMLIGSGVAPIPKMLKAGITVGLGVDGAASNNNQDMFELMKTTALLHKVSALDPLVMTAEKVLEMATIDGARCLGLENEIGSIELGKKADIITVDLKQPNILPVNRVPSQLVYCGKASNVNNVIIDGRLVLKDREITTINEEDVMMNVQKCSDKLLERNGALEMRVKPWKSIP